MIVCGINVFKFSLCCTSGETSQIQSSKHKRIASKKYVFLCFVVAENQDFSLFFHFFSSFFSFFSFFFIFLSSFFSSFFSFFHFFIFFSFSFFHSFFLFYENTVWFCLICAAIFLISHLSMRLPERE